MSLDAAARAPARESAKLEGFADLLCCPKSHAPIVGIEDGRVRAEDGTSYDLQANGVPIFARDFVSEEARAQQALHGRAPAAA